MLVKIHARERARVIHLSDCQLLCGSLALLQVAKDGILEHTLDFDSGISHDKMILA